LFSSADIIRLIKYRRMGVAGHVARIWEERNAYRTLEGNLKAGEHFFFCKNQQMLGEAVDLY
jgi:hypothetical protein